jgi:cytochrome P450
MDLTMDEQEPQTDVDSIFTTDGESWHNSRQLIRPQFIKTRVSDLQIFEKHVHKMLSQIRDRGQEVDSKFVRDTLHCLVANISPVSALFYR